MEKRDMLGLGYPLRCEPWIVLQAEDSVHVYPSLN